MKNHVSRVAAKELGEVGTLFDIFNDLASDAGMFSLLLLFVEVVRDVSRFVECSRSLWINVEVSSFDDVGNPLFAVGNDSNVSTVVVIACCEVEAVVVVGVECFCKLDITM